MGVRDRSGCVGGMCGGSWLNWEIMSWDAMVMSAVKKVEEASVKAEAVSQVNKFGIDMHDVRSIK